MATAKAKEQEEKKREAVNVTKPYRNLYSWIDEVGKGIIAEALRQVKEPYLKVPLPRHPEDLAEELTNLRQEREKTEERYEGCRERLKPLWAQKGRTEITASKSPKAWNLRST